MRPSFPSPTLFVDLTTPFSLQSGRPPGPDLPTWIAEAILASSLMYKQIILTEDKRGPTRLSRSPWMLAAAPTVNVKTWYRLILLTPMNREEKGEMHGYPWIQVCCDNFLPLIVIKVLAWNRHDLLISHNLRCCGTHLETTSTTWQNELWSMFVKVFSRNSMIIPALCSAPRLAGGTIRVFYQTYSTVYFVP